MWEGVFCSVGWKPSSSCTSLMPVYALSCAAFAPDAISFPAASACRRFCSSAARSAAASPGPNDASPAGFFLRTTRPGSARVVGIESYRTINRPNRPVGHSIDPSTHVPVSFVGAAQRRSSEAGEGQGESTLGACGGFGGRPQRDNDDGPRTPLGRTKAATDPMVAATAAVNSRAAAAKGTLPACAVLLPLR